MLFKSIRGTDGRVTIPSIGALIGYFSGWQLVADPKTSAYTLTATFGYLNPKLWQKTESGDYTRQITVQVGKEKFYRIGQADGASISLKDTTLVMEGVSLAPVE